MVRLSQWKERGGGLSWAREFPELRKRQGSVKDPERGWSSSGVHSRD